MWTSIIEILQTNHHFIISSHLNPDCDAFGSELALAYHLLYLGKTVNIINTDPVIADYQFLDPDGLIQWYVPQLHDNLIAQADTIIVLDASGHWGRLGIVGQVLAQTKAQRICIDHHPTDNDDFAHFSYIDPEVIATGELIFGLITAMAGEITPLMAQALYAAILTDSGGFRFPKTTAQTHRITANLLEKGANPSKIYHLLYQQQPLLKVRLKSYVLANIQLAAEGQVAYVGITSEVLAQYQTDPLDLNNFNNLAQDIKGVRIAIFAVELAPGRIKISLRSDGSIIINQLAAEFGGGGHTAAAGATVCGSLSEVLKQVVEKACLLV